MNITTCNSNSNDPINIYSHLEQCHPACHPSILDPTTVLDDIQSNTSFPRQGTARGTNYAHVSRCNKSCAEPSTHHRDFFSARPRPRDDRSNEPQGARQLTSLYKSARSSPAKVSPTDTTAPPINRTRTQHRAKLPFPFARISSRAQGVFLIFFFFRRIPLWWRKKYRMQRYNSWRRYFLFRSDFLESSFLFRDRIVSSRNEKNT